MSNLTVFKNQDFGEIRTTLINNQPYFCLADVCRILDIKNVSDCKERLKKECIFQSRQTYAEKFQDWITEEVLPEIRKTGSYSLVPKSYAEALRMYADEVEQRELMQKQRDEGTRPHRPIREQKKAQAKKLQSRAETWVRNKGSFASFSSSKKREAMNTAGQKSKEVEKLKIELDRSKKFSSIKAAETRLKSKFDWKPLRNYCTSHELEMPKIFDANYGSVRTYPAEAWQAIYGLDLKELF